MDNTAGSAQTLLIYVGQLLNEEYRQLRGVGGEVALLRDDLAAMNALLRMEAEADESTMDHFVREWIKQLREVAYDVEDCVDLYRLRIKCGQRDNFYYWIKHMLQTLLQRRRLASEIKVLRSRAIAINERRVRYGVNQEPLRRSLILSSLPMMTAPAHGLRRANNPGQHHQLVGIDEQAATLTDEMVKAAAEGEPSIKVFSIVGFGGVGKTTLAKVVCRRLAVDFPCQAMVSVSEAFEPSRDLKPLLKRVLQQVVKPKSPEDGEKGVKEESPLDGIDGWDDDMLAQKLKESLQDKRYLIMIDDVWTIQTWECIKWALPENNRDSRIIVTTRIETVAEASSTSTFNGSHIHHMKPLNATNSKNLLLSRVFGTMNVESCPKNLRFVMDEILEKCGGYPLAIISIASILAEYRSPGSIDKWKTISKSIGSLMEILTLSYSHLPYELKGCMMYFSIFPEDYEINKDRLLCRWVAEGLVQEKRGLTRMEVAESYLEELLRRNMIEPRFGMYGKVESYKVHDMHLEVMVSRTLESNFVRLHGGLYARLPYDNRIRTRRLSIQGDDMTLDADHELPNPPKKKILGYRKKHSNIEDMDLEHVRSLSMFQLNEGHKLLDQLHKFTLLRVLDVEGCEGITNDHLKIVCRMYLLKFLNLKDTNISEVPQLVGNLEHLQTFDVSCTRLGDLPETVTNLEKLERIVFSNRDDWTVLWKIPRGIGRMKALREMSLALLGNDDQVARELGKLDKLQKLAIYINSYENISTDVLGVLAKSLSKAYSLRSLDIGDQGFTDILKFMHDLKEPPRLLRYFRVTGDIGRGLPCWIRSLTYLVEVVVSFTYFNGDEPLCNLCNLPNLKSIIMEQQYYKDKELVARATQNFPALINLTMSSSVNNNEMPEVFKFEDGSMSKLEMLKFNFGKYNKRIEGIEHLPNLKEVHLIGKKNNATISYALDQLKAENGRRESNKQLQFQIVLTYQAQHRSTIW